MGDSASRKWLGWQKDTGLQIGDCIEVTAKNREGQMREGRTQARPQLPTKLPGTALVLQEPKPCLVSPGHKVGTPRDPCFMRHASGREDSLKRGSGPGEDTRMGEGVGQGERKNKVK